MSLSPPPKMLKRAVVRVPVQVQLDEDLAEWARHHRARTRVTVSELINQLLRDYSKDSKQPKPA